MYPVLDRRTKRPSQTDKDLLSKFFDQVITLRHFDIYLSSYQSIGLFVNWENVVDSCVRILVPTSYTTVYLRISPPSVSQGLFVPFQKPNEYCFCPISCTVTITHPILVKLKFLFFVYHPWLELFYLLFEVVYNLILRIKFIMKFLSRIRTTFSIVLQKFYIIYVQVIPVNNFGPF